jgi:hypothetical protein
LFIVIVAVLAAQEPAPQPETEPSSPVVATPSAPAPPPPQRLTSSKEVGRLYDPRRRAAKTCWDTGTEIRCDEDKMRRFNVVETAAIEQPADLVVSSSLAIHKDKPCVVAVNFTMTSASDALTVDWSKVAVDVDRVALQAVPGFARRATSNLVQRPSTAAAGTVLAEGVFVVDGTEDACMTPMEPREDWTTITVRMPVRVGERDDVVIFKHALNWEDADEKRVVGLLAVPSEEAEPERPLTGTIAGAGFGLGVGALAGVASAVGNTQGGMDLSQAVIVAVIGGGVTAGCIGGVCAGIGWGFSDGPEWTAAGHVDERRAARQRLLAKRRQLGIDPPPETQAAQAF